MEIIDITVTRNDSDMKLIIDRMDKYNKINDIIIQIANHAMDKEDFELVLRMVHRRKENLSNQLFCLEDMLEYDKGTKDGDVLLVYNALKIKNDECDRMIILIERTYGRNKE